MHYKTLIITHLIFFVSVITIQGQIWSPLASAKTPQNIYSEVEGERLQLDVNAFENLAFTNADEFSFPVPFPSGEKKVARLHDNSVIADGLARKYPAIKSWKGQINGNAVYASYGADGLHLMIFSDKGTIFVDPLLKNSKSQYISYLTQDYKSTKRTFRCAFDAEKHLPEGVEINQPTKDGDQSLRKSRNTDSTSTLKTFRLAVACTGEYANFHGGDTMSVLSAMSTTMTRVNGIYERDLGLRMEIIPENNDIIFLNPDEDPYEDNNTFQLLTQNQETIDTRVGTDAYDIGHVFSTGGGGLASLESVCQPNRKAEGVTGLSFPMGDVFNIDYVAHEMGHQFGATHTFNNACNGNRTNETAFEPGSGYSIMGYAGICAPNVQSNSDALFHGGSIIQMQDFIVTLDCPEVDTFDNSPPMATLDKPLYTIPARTPFLLDVDATDADGDDLTYSWEQYDVGIATMPPEGDSEVGPLFRGYLPTDISRRYFPDFLAVVNGIDLQWEELPTITRNMEFGVTIRDNDEFAPRIHQLFVEVESFDTGEKFRITSPEQEAAIAEKSNFTLEWNVAGTDESPISTSEVDIFVSENTSTFDDTIAMNVANDGNYEFTLDFDPDKEYRFMVRGNDNIFYAVSDVVSIVEGMNISVLDQQLYKCPDVTDTLLVYIPGEYDEEIDFEVNNLPQGLDYTTVPNSTFGQDSLWFIITDDGSVQNGIYNVDFVFEVKGVHDTVDIQYEVGIENIDSPTEFQVSSVNDYDVNLSWIKVPEDDINYQIQVSDVPTFDRILVDTMVGDINNVIMSAAQAEINYFRLRAVNICVLSDWVSTEINSNCGRRDLLNERAVSEGKWIVENEGSDPIIREESNELSAFIGTEGGLNTSSLSRQIQLSEFIHSGELVIPYSVRRFNGNCNSEIIFTVRNEFGDIIASKQFTNCLQDEASGSIVMSLNCAEAGETVTLEVTSTSNAFSQYYIILQAVMKQGCKTQCNLPLSPTNSIVRQASGSSCIFKPIDDFQYLTSTNDSMIVAVNPLENKIGTYNVSIAQDLFSTEYVTNNGEIVTLLSRSFGFENIENCSSGENYVGRLFFTENEFQMMDGVNSVDELGVSFITNSQDSTLNSRSKELLNSEVADIDLVDGIHAIDVEVPRKDGEIILHSIADTLADLWLKLKADPLDSTILTEWEVDSDLNIDKAYLQRSTDRNNYESIDTTDYDGSESFPISYEYEDTSVIKETEYFYRLKTIGNNDSVRYSLVVRAGINISSNVNSELSDFALYPNPHRDYVNFRHRNVSSFRVTVYNAQGQKVDKIEYRADSHRYETSALSSGVYYMRVFRNGEYAGTTSFIKM